MRLVGITVSNLTADDSPLQLDLFGDNGQGERRKLNNALDRINQRFGPQTIKPGALQGE